MHAYIYTYMRAHTHIYTHAHTPFGTTAGIQCCMRLQDWRPRPTPPPFIILQPETGCVPAPYSLRMFVAGTRACNERRVPALYDLPTCVASTRACKESACACSILFADNCCRRACLQRKRVCLQHLICGHVLQTRVPTMKARMPTPCYSQHLK